MSSRVFENEQSKMLTHLSGKEPKLREVFAFDKVEIAVTKENDTKRIIAVAWRKKGGESKK